MEKENYELIDNAEKKQYEFHVEDQIVKVEYIKSKSGEIYLTHTEVPMNLEGRGLASQIISKILPDIEKQELSLIPLCPFVVKYIEKHPEWQRIVKNDK